MPEKSPKFQMASLDPHDFVAIPNWNIAVTRTEVRTARDRVLANINWFEAKLLVQNLGPDYFMLTLSQWRKARDFLVRGYPSVEMDFATGENEWVDSLLAFPSGERAHACSEIGLKMVFIRPP